jgi:hypothetical protein
LTPSEVVKNSWVGSSATAANVDIVTAATVRSFAISRMDLLVSADRSAPSHDRLDD